MKLRQNFVDEPTKTDVFAVDLIFADQKVPEYFLGILVQCFSDLLTVIHDEVAVVSDIFGVLFFKLTGNAFGDRGHITPAGCQCRVAGLFSNDFRP